ncbi:hypothetical protein Ancab_016714 [Ancistrocladus abbreviatus]
MEKDLLGYETIDLSKPNTADELKMFLKHHELPLCKDSRTGITEMVASVGHFCTESMDMLSRYINYKPSGQCPGDISLTQKLILKGCEPLPRRRCFANTISKEGYSHCFNDNVFDLVHDGSALDGSALDVGGKPEKLSS